MDSDLWISRLMAAKRQYALQRAQRHHAAPASHHVNALANRFGYDDIEPEDEVRSDFPCPYCYEDHDITSLCTHLEDEHPLESKVVACPVCSARISKDLLDHITLQHGYLFKTCRDITNYVELLVLATTLSYEGRDLQDTYLKVLLGNSGRSGTSTSSSITNSLLSSLVLNLSSSEAKDTSESSAPAMGENNWFKRALPSKTRKTSAADSNLSHEERERRRRRAAVRSAFVHHLLVTTLFDD